MQSKKQWNPNAKKPVIKKFGIGEKLVQGIEVVEKDFEEC